MLPVKAPMEWRSRCVCVRVQTTIVITKASIDKALDTAARIRIRMPHHYDLRVAVLFVVNCQS
jgi:hypothetical protein